MEGAPRLQALKSKRNLIKKEQSKTEEMRGCWTLVSSVLPCSSLFLCMKLQLLVILL
jgi:hypothetical protein